MALTKVSTPAIKDEAITLAKLLHGDSNSNGKFLRANNGADPTFETISSVGGATGVDFNDNVKARFGTGNDLEIYHNGSSGNYIDSINKDLYLRCNLDAGITGGDIILQPKSGENSAIFRDNGAVELYYNGVKQIETLSNGVRLKNGHLQLNEADNMKAIFGASDDLQIYHDGSNWNYIKNENSKNLAIQTNGENAIIAVPDSEVGLYYDNGKKLSTVSNGVIIDNNCRIENINNKVASMVNAKSSVEYKVHQTNGQSALQGAIKSNGISGWGGDLEFYTKRADSNPNGSLTRRARLTEVGQFVLSDQPYSMVSRSSGQSVPNTSGTTIVFDSQHYDRGNNYNHTNGRFTAPIDGVYQVNVQAQYTGNINQCHAGVERNGSNPGVSNSFDPWCNWGDDIRAAYFAQAIYLYTGDYIEAKTYHSNGGNRTLEANRTKMTIYLLG